MAGLLDILNSDDARLGMGLLAAGGYSPTPMSFGQRVSSAFQGVDQRKQDMLKQKLLESQVAENTSQNALRLAQGKKLEEQALFDRQFFGGGGLLGAGAGSPAVPGAPATVGSASAGQSGASAGGFTAEQISKQFGVPYEAVVADYRFNGGKKIAELIADRAKPNWQNVNGNLVNTNAPGFSGGMQAGMASSADGKVTAWQPDGQGSVVVGAPRGAVDTFRAYQGASADFKPIKIYNPVTGREEFTSEGNVVAPSRAAPNRGEAGMRVAAQGDMGPDPAAIQRELAQATADLGRVTDPNSKAQLQAYITDLQGQAQRVPAGNIAAGPSAAESALNKAAETKAVDTAKADVTRDSARQADIKTATKFLNITKQVEDVFKMGPTDSGMGSLVDSGAAFFGKSTDGAEAAQRLKALGGWLVANVPRMEGPQSNFDVANYQVQAADVANDKLPLARRKAALESVKAMMNGVVSGEAGPAPDAGSDKPKGRVVDALPTPNASNKGQRIRDTSTGKVLRSNGLQWKEE